MRAGEQHLTERDRATKARVLAAAAAVAGAVAAAGGVDLAITTARIAVNHNESPGS